MILLRLFGVFAKIGAFTYGGGYAMVSLIQDELENQGWLGAAEFADIVAVSQMTPGPLALNVATYVGRQVAGIPGALLATLGLVFPAIVITTLAFALAKAGRRIPRSKAAVRGIRGAVLGLIATAVLFFLENSAVRGLPEGPVWRGDAGPVSINFIAVAIFGLALLIAGRWKQGPLKIIGGAAVLGAGLGLVGIL